MRSRQAVFRRRTSPVKSAPSSSGQIAGRRTEAEVTIYKSLGVAAQDIAAASIVYERAVANAAARSPSF